MNQDRIEELVSAFASGEITPVEMQELERALKTAPPQARQRCANLVDTFSTLALAVPRHSPAPSLKRRILEKVLTEREMAPVQKAPPAPAQAPFTFLFGDSTEGWQALPIAGASVKLLSLNAERGFAVVLGKLEPGARYPAHTHIEAEEVYVLSGDLHIGDVAMKAGDFHHAAAGSTHDVNWSEAGCTIMAIISVKDLQAQFATA